MTPILLQDVDMDLFSDLPSVYSFQTILIVVDKFSKMLHLLPLGPNTTVEILTRAIFRTVAQFNGVSSSVISERDFHC